MDLDPTFQRRLKAVAALKGVTMRQYCQTAIAKELANDEAQGILGPVSSRSDAARFEDLQQKYFGDTILPGSGADLIREAREEREAQLEGLL